MKGLESAIGNFFFSFSDFAKTAEEEVSNLKRSLDNGYSLDPQQFKEKLRETQTRCKELETSCTAFDEAMRSSVSLTELSNRYLIVYQNIASGIGTLEAHLKNYGYQDNQCEKAPFDPIHLCHSPTQSLASLRTKSNLRGSVRRTQVQPDSDSVFGGLIEQGRGSLASLSSISQGAFQYSPDTLALKQKYGSGQEGQPLNRISLDNSEKEASSQSFEFHPTPQMVNQNVKEEETVRRSSTLSALPRMSYSVDQSRFGSPFRSARSKPEKSVFATPVDPPPPKIDRGLYDTLPTYLKKIVSIDTINSAFEALLNSKSITGQCYIPQSELEDLSCDKYVIQAFFKLGILERQFKGGVLGYQAGPKWPELVN